MKRLLCLLAVLSVPALCADVSMAPMLVKHWKTSKAYTIAVAEKMPEDGYASKPNPAQMTFAEQLVHLAGANAYFVSTVAGAKADIAKPSKLDKASVINFLNTTFDYVIKTVEGLTPEQLGKEIDTPDGKMNGLGAVMFAMDHTTHHRGQCIVYLRVKDIAPPEYEY